MNLAKLKKNSTGYLFLAPFIIGFLIFGLYPVINTLTLSFTDATLMSKSSHFVGIANFKRLFADEVFMRAVGNTWLIWILNFIPQIGIALLLSVLFTSARLKIKAVGVWRAIYFLPNLLMPAAVAALFNALFAYYGPVNQFMVRADLLSEAMRFLESITVTRGLVVFIQWWTWFGQTMIILMAGMTSIPLPLYEAAMVDGASVWQMFTRITLPLLKPILIFIFVTSLVGGMQMFDIPFLLTDGRGSPLSSIQTNNILMYMKFASSKGHIGAASSVGVLIFIMTSICALGIFYFLRDKDMDDTKPAKKIVLQKEHSEAAIMINNYKFGTSVMRFFVYSLLFILLILTIVPIWLLIVNATRSTTEIQQGISILPSTHLIENYRLLISKGLNLPRGFANSLFLAAASTVVTVYFSLLTAYGVVVYNFAGKKLFSNFIIVLVMIPMQLSIIGFYQYMSKLGLTDNYASLILPLVANAGAVFFGKQYLESMVIHDLIDAGRIDGASELSIFHTIMLPLAVPGAVTMGIFAFVASWNNFFTPFILISSIEKYTLPMLVQTLRGDVYRTEYGAIYLGLALTVVPIIIIYAIFSRYIISGIALGAVKE